MYNVDTQMQNKNKNVDVPLTFKGKEKWKPPARKTMAAKYSHGKTYQTTYESSYYNPVLHQTQKMGTS